MEWAKVLFVGIGCDEVVVGGKVTGPNMGTMGVLKDVKYQTCNNKLIPRAISQYNRRQRNRVMLMLI